MNDKTVFNWLMTYGKMIVTGREWSVLLNVRVIDSDGWDDKTLFSFSKIPLTEYLERVSRSTIS